MISKRVGESLSTAETKLSGADRHLRKLKPMYHALGILSLHSAKARCRERTAVLCSDDWMQPNFQATSTCGVTNGAIERNSQTMTHDRAGQNPMLVPGLLITYPGLNKGRPTMIRPSPQQSTNVVGPDNPDAVGWPTAPSNS